MPKRKREQLWINKYRPISLNDIVYQDNVVQMLKNIIINKNLPHLLFYGPPGTGKTSTILAVARELFGPIKIKERIIELNASDERGINIVRKKIINFAKKSVGNGDPNYPSPPYKIIILDEADAMTKEAQSALRKVMENYSKITRFCFICNYEKQIISPIQSRCVKLRFKQLDNKSMTKKLKNIMSNEGLGVGDKVVEEIVTLSCGDLRKAIIMTQNLKFINTNPKKITINDIKELFCDIPDDLIKEIKQKCLIDNTCIIDLIEFSNNIIYDGYSINKLLNKILLMIINEKLALTDEQKGYICLHFSEVEKMLIDGADELLQLQNILIYIKKVVNLF